MQENPFAYSRMCIRAGEGGRREREREREFALLFHVAERGHTFKLCDSIDLCVIVYVRVFDRIVYVREFACSLMVEWVT
jgi:hypothetical protein